MIVLRTQTGYFHFSSLLTVSNPALLCTKEGPGSPCFLDHPEVTVGEKDVYLPLPSGASREHQCARTGCTGG